MSNVKNIIENINAEDLVSAKSLIKEELLRRVGAVLEEQIEVIAPSMISEVEERDMSKEESEKPSKKPKKKIKSWKKDDDDSKSSKNESYESEEILTPNNKLVFDDEQEFEDFVDEIQEIVQEIEDETGEELTEQEIQDIGREYLNYLSEELDEGN